MSTPQSSKKVLFLAPVPDTIFLFHGELIKALLGKAVGVGAVSNFSKWSGVPVTIAGVGEFDVPFGRQGVGGLSAILQNLRAIREACTISSSGDMLLFCHAPMGILYGLLASYLFGIRLVVTIHGRLVRKRSFGAAVYNKIIEPLAVRRSEKVFVVNFEDQEAIRQYCSEENKVECISNTGVGVPPEVRAALIAVQRNRLPYDGRAIRFGFLGRFSVDKGSDAILHMLQKGIALNSLVHAGSIESSDAHGKALKFAQFNYLGSLQREDIDKFLAQIDILLFPSKREGLGMAVIEAILAGVPVVAFNIPGVRQSIVDGVNGILVQSDNFDDYFDAAQYLASRLPEFIDGCRKSQALYDHDNALYKQFAFFERRFSLVAE